jgi:FKBP-type peptidyl-prolyl cis-trans isomerase SlyD
MAIEKNSVVLFHYTLTLDDGEEIDSSKGGDPFAYLHGHGNIVPGLEKEMLGKEAGAVVEAHVSPEEGYGVHDPELDMRVPKEVFPPEAAGDLQAGMMFQSQHPKDPNQDIILNIVGVEDDVVYVSGNHPLAGKALNFAVEVISIREATTEELAHGHVHGPGGHNH